MSISLYSRLAKRFGPRKDEISRREMLRTTALLSAGLLLSNRIVFAQQNKKPGSVVVVGAGFAGLAAAHELLAAGYDVSIVEARKRVGGRVLSLSDFIDGRVVEGGAELVGDNHTTWLAYAEKFGLKFDTLSDDDEFFVLDGKKLSEEDAKKLYDDLTELSTAMAKESLPINADEPWKSPGAAELDRKSLADWLREYKGSDLAKKVFDLQWTANSGVPSNKQSYLGFLATIKGGMLLDPANPADNDKHLLDYFEISETCRCAGGNQQLAMKLADAIGKNRIQLGLAVTEIKLTGKGCTVRCADDRTYECDDVVLATPPTTWSKIKFEPGMPDKLKPQMGVNVKYLAEVKKRFWSDAGLTQYAISDTDVNMTWEATDKQPGDDKFCLTSFSGGPSADACRARQGAALDEAYKKTLEKLMPGFGASFVKSRFMDWPGDPWTLASYSFPGPGEVTTVGPMMFKGIGEHLHFAGEHTCYQFAGYMEGALRSGVSLAKRIAQRDGIKSAAAPQSQPATK